MSRFESLRRLAAQLSSLATLEDAVAHGVQGSLGGASGACGPGSCRGACPSLCAPPPPLALSLSSTQGRSPAVPAAPSCSASAVPRDWSCLVAPSDRSVSSCRHSCSSASAAGPVESRSTAGVARSSAPSESACCRFRSHHVRCSQGQSEASCLKRRRSEATQEGQAPPSGATTHQSLDVARDFSVKHPRAVQCGLAAPTPRPMMTTTKPTTMRSWRRCCCPACRRLTSTQSTSFESRSTMFWETSRWGFKSK